MGELSNLIFIGGDLKQSGISIFQASGLEVIPANRLVDLQASSACVVDLQEVAQNVFYTRIVSHAK